ncbi:hypothetical protein GB937_004088 [Aspergillus fischeri]|nr:hypothetical protein GB937_004088 [Aspergillus fischeri]
MTDTAQLTALESFLQEHSTIIYIPPSSADYLPARKVWNGSRRDKPLAIVQLQSPSDVASLIRFATSQSLLFTLRSGGHNLEGRSIVDGRPAHRPARSECRHQRTGSQDAAESIWR